MADLTLKITIYNVHNWALDPGMLEAVLKHCASFAGSATHIDVYPQERRETGFLEWILRVISPGAALTIGCVQRVPGNPYEFHS